MKTKILIIFLFLGLYFDTAAQNWSQTTGPKGYTLTDLVQTNNKIWAATKGGLFYSTNEGRN